MTKGKQYDLQDRLVESVALLAPLLQETDELTAALFTIVEIARKNKER